MDERVRQASPTATPLGGDTAKSTDPLVMSVLLNQFTFDHGRSAHRL